MHSWIPVPRRTGRKKREGTLPLLSMSAHLAIVFAWKGGGSG